MDKAIAAAQTLVPLVEDVVQNPTLAVDAANNPPVFTYECDPAKLIGTNCLAEDIKTVYIALRVQSARMDLDTRRQRRITIQGAASRLNPSR